MNVLRLQRFGGAGFLLGFASGGFFDGILLHQILQWHHLLSAVPSAPFDDLRVQILADGAFHGVMYLVAAVGLWKLLRAHRALAAPGAGRDLAAHALIGFGSWHVVDGVLSHWLLGIHRIRMDVPNPLFWDLLWFTLFGILFIAGGVALLRQRAAAESRMYGWVAPLLAVAALTAGAFAARMPDNGSVTVVLRPGAAPADLLKGLDEDARVVWSSAGGEVWVLALERPRDAYRLYAHGALLVSGTVLPAGCSAWITS
ncbi:MAG TPA: DUF2243 domain-containing protein [Noviherbaspirillum sp.]|jgi:uncharacterized membrane protein|uniref:DUF2243 domain-containing protein n=1 Tax=Noviherbaspirillum sp. TaxID=1926288 RepID=UPI002F91D9F7